MEARIVILNYNGQDLLPQCLPGIVDAAARSRSAVRVTVLDNLSTDRGLDYVRRNFPQVHVETAPANRFLCSYNGYLAGISEPVVILLNNDIRVDPGFIDPLLAKFRDDPAAFLAAPRVMNFDGSAIEAGRSKAGMRFGMFWCEARYPGYEKDLLTPSETVSSGFGAFSREKFLALGGYDNRYLPGIMEDVDLCLAARRAGYRLYYEPASLVYHLGQASFKKAFGDSGISVIAHRNTFLFMWKNFGSAGFWLHHVFFLPLRLAAAALRGQWTLISGFWKAVQIQCRIKK